MTHTVTLGSCEINDILRDWVRKKYPDLCNGKIVNARFHQGHQLIINLSADVSIEPQPPSHNDDR